MIRSLLVALAIALGAIATAAHAQVRVEGYFKKDGTYVQPHYRSRPDNSYNNWSVSPNVNPYIGRRGTRSPTFTDKAPYPLSYGNYGVNKKPYRRDYK